MSHITASPSIRAKARKMGIDIEAHAKALGRTHITLDDLKVSAQKATQDLSGMHKKYWDVDHSQYGDVTREPMSRFAQVACQNLAAANELIPQVTHHDHVDISQLEAFRTSLKSEALERGIKVTMLSFHVKALAHTLKTFPLFNASLSADEKALIKKQYVHIGIAVDTPHGLMVPVIRDADKKGIFEISIEITQLAAAAQARKLPPEDMGGASMSISNLGGIGGIGFSPIVNPPELAILGITKTQIMPIWNGQIFEPTPMTPLDLSYDHRVINGADAARFLAYYCQLISKPQLMV